MNCKRLSPIAILLWLETVGLISCGLYFSQLWFLPCAGILALFAALLSRGLFLSLPLATSTAAWWLIVGKANPVSLPTLVAVLAVVLGIASAFLGILSSIHGEETKPKLHAKLGQLATFGHFVAAGFLFADRFLTLSTAAVFAYVAAAASLILCLDVALKWISRIYTPRRHWQALPPIGAFFFFRWLGPEWRALLPAKDESSDEMSLKLAEMWMWPTVKNALPALACVTLAIVFASSSLHEIGPRFQGVRHHFGTWGSQSLQPGFHLSMPWPLGGIRQVETGPLHETVLGFKTDPGNPILWERAHYGGESMSLVGEGDDFLSISVPIFFRIQDAAAYLKSSTDSESLLRNLGDRILLRLTIRESAGEIMTTARESMRAEFHRQLQAELDQMNAGIVVTEVYFRDIHPPVEVAPFFQGVISAMEDKEAYIHSGEAYQRDIVTRASGTAKQILTTAEASSDNRILGAEGEASRFTSLSKARAENPALYEFREGFRMLDLTLGGAKKAIFDEKMSGQMPTHLDLRRVLNPDFVSAAGPAPQSLVPHPGKSLDAFNMDIEGYLKSNQGELPAIQTSPNNPDNLLENP